MKKIVLIIALTSLFISLALLMIGEAFDFDFITNSMITNGGSYLLLFFFTTLFLYFFLRSKMKFFKILFMFIFIFLIYINVLGVIAINDVFQDRSAYNNQNFETITGIPNNEDFEKSKHIQNPHLTEFEIDGTTLDAVQLKIEKEVYYSQYQNQQLEVLFLPNSKIAVELNLVEAD